MQFATITRFRNSRKAFTAAMNQITADANARRFTAPELAELQTKMPKWIDAGKRFDQVEGVIRGVENVTGNLGALPVLAAPAAIAAVAGVTYLLTKTLTEVSQFLQRRSYLTKRAGEGVDTATAMSEWSKSNPQDGGLFGDASKLLWPVAIIGAVFLVMRGTK